VRRWAEVEVFPHGEAWREDGMVSREIWRSAGAQGFLCMDAGWALIDHCAREHPDGALSAEMAAEAKLYASEVEGRVADECLPLHGGAGYMDEYEISRVFADARISHIYAGSSEIMKEIIGRKLGLGERKRN